MSYHKRPPPKDTLNPSEAEVALHYWKEKIINRLRKFESAEAHLLVRRLQQDTTNEITAALLATPNFRPNEFTAQNVAEMMADTGRPGVRRDWAHAVEHHPYQEHVADREAVRTRAPLLRFLNARELGQRQHGRRHGAQPITLPAFTRADPADDPIPAHYLTPREVEQRERNRANHLAETMQQQIDDTHNVIRSYENALGRGLNVKRKRKVHCR